MRGRTEKPQVEAAADAKKQIEMCWRALCAKDARQTTEGHAHDGHKHNHNCGEDRRLKGRKSCTGKGGRKTVAANT